jgi:uncharacterized membrane protein
MNAPISPPAGSPPDFPNLYVMFWPVFNILILIAIVVLVFWYFKKQSNDKKRMLEKLDSILSLL